MIELGFELFSVRVEFSNLRYDIYQFFSDVHVSAKKYDKYVLFTFSKNQRFFMQDLT